MQFGARGSADFLHAMACGQKGVKARRSEPAEARFTSPARYTTSFFTVRCAPQIRSLGVEPLWRSWLAGRRSASGVPSRDDPDPLSNLGSGSQAKPHPVKCPVASPHVLPRSSTGGRNLGAAPRVSCLAHSFLISTLLAQPAGAVVRYRLFTAETHSNLRKMVFPGHFSTGCLRCRQRKVKVGLEYTALTRPNSY